VRTSSRKAPLRRPPFFNPAKTWRKRANSPRPRRTPDEKKYLVHQFTRPYVYESIISEAASLSFRAGRPAVDYVEIKQAERSWGNKPVIVLTAGADPDLPNDKGYAAFWKSGHDRLAARSTRGESIVVPNAAHYIQLDQPAQVVAAIGKVVTEVRQAGMR
jgi:pimeloyl-ACP methyl ester carboxylesterase